MCESTAPTLLLYCQHSLGLGHLRRSWALSAALAQKFTVVLLNGGAEVSGFSAPDGVQVRGLPALAQEVDGPLLSLDPAVSVAEALTRREQIILETFRWTQPAVVVIELFPFGRKKFARELLALLRATRLAPRPLVVCSVRDILVGRGAAQQEHDDWAAAIAEEYFDAVLVHADAAFARLEETFRPLAPLHVPIHYTGFVVPERAPVPDSPAAERRILVSAGGGRYGQALFETAIAAFPLLRDRLGCGLTIVAGPMCPDGVWEQMCASVSGMPRVTIHRSVPDLFPLIAASTVSVSQCGYNTALDLWQARVPAVVVPFDESGEDEQMNRARRLERLGVVRVLESAKLTGAALATGIARAMRQHPTSQALDLDGARRSASLLSALVRTHDQSGIASSSYVVQE